MAPDPYKEPMGFADKITMEFSSITSMLSSGAAYNTTGQASIYALKKTLDASQAQANALVQMLEQIPAPQLSSGHQIDLYA